MKFIPPISPYGLIQESLWPNEWLILVSCMMLNCTTRKQVEKVLPIFLKKWPTPNDLLTCDMVDLVTTISPLGFGNKRADNLIKMTKHYLMSNWTHAGQLPGIGQYASAAWEIFCVGRLSDQPPKDHALVKYWTWALKHFKSSFVG
jgi:methyl-CpG-binding domain protein 4